MSGIKRKEDSVNLPSRLGGRRDGFLCKTEAFGRACGQPVYTHHAVNASIYTSSCSERKYIYIHV